MSDSRIYRRKILFRGGHGALSVDVEDDQHRFGVDISHDGALVTSIKGRALRTPWSICPGATALLSQLDGAPLLRSPFAVLRRIKLGEHCTHLVDMAALAISGAARGVKGRVYDVAVTAESQGDTYVQRAIMQCDDGAPTQWTFENGVIAAPSHFAGQELRRAASWASDRTTDEDEIERLLVLQRALFVALTLRRTIAETDALERATDSLIIPGACYSLQAERVNQALRNHGTKLDMTHARARLLADLSPADG